MFAEINIWLKTFNSNIDNLLPRRNTLAEFHKYTERMRRFLVYHVQPAACMLLEVECGKYC